MTEAIIGEGVKVAEEIAETEAPAWFRAFSKDFEKVKEKVESWEKKETEPLHGPEALALLNPPEPVPAYSVPVQDTVPDSMTAAQKELAALRSEIPEGLTSAEYAELQQLRREKVARVNADARAKSGGTDGVYGPLADGETRPHTHVIMLATGDVIRTDDTGIATHYGVPGKGTYPVISAYPLQEV